MIPQIYIPIPPGELFDRISILKLKVSHAKNPLQKENFAVELGKLQALATPLPKSPDLSACFIELDQDNAILWDMEDQLRLLERDQSFGEEFIKLARSVYQTNDRRCALKRQINHLMGLADPGEKVYSAGN